jgi:uncharacterized caspase-like protein
MTLNAHALVIGVSQYEHVQRLPRVDDAEDVAAVLRDPAACGYEPSNVAVLKEWEATRARIVDELDRLAQRAAGDATVLIYFSGHGGRPPGDVGDSYLMPVDGEWGSRERLDATAISSRHLGVRLAAIRAERLTVILDCCHAGALAHARDVTAAAWVPEVADDALARLAAGRGRVVMAASRGDGAAYVMNGARHGLFTEHLIAGLRGAAVGADGLVRVLDLYHHAQRNVVAREPAQRPVLKTELEDNSPVARVDSARPALGAPAAATEFAYDVLVVHAPDERDTAWARYFIRRLEERDVRVCTEDLAELGEARVLALERLVASSRFTLPILTPRFPVGRFQDLQTVMAQHLGVDDGRARLIPIVRETSDARLGLRMLVHLDMIRDENVALGIDRLVRTLHKARPG